MENFNSKIPSWNNDFLNYNFILENYLDHEIENNDFKPNIELIDQEMQESDDNLEDTYEDIESKFNQIKNQDLDFNSDNDVQKAIELIDYKSEVEMEKYTKILPKNFTIARGRGRHAQLKSLTDIQKESEKNFKLTKNKYSARRSRLKRKYEVEKLIFERNFYEKKNKEYEKLFQKLFSKNKVKK